MERLARLGVFWSVFADRPIDWTFCWCFGCILGVDFGIARCYGPRRLVPYGRDRSASNLWLFARVPSPSRDRIGRKNAVCRGLERHQTAQRYNFAGSHPVDREFGRAANYWYAFWQRIVWADLRIGHRVDRFDGERQPFVLNLRDFLSRALQ